MFYLLQIGQKSLLSDVPVDGSLSPENGAVASTHHGARLLFCNCQGQQLQPLGHWLGLAGLVLGLFAHSAGLLTRDLLSCNRFDCHLAACLHPLFRLLCKLVKPANAQSTWTQTGNSHRKHSSCYCSLWPVHILLFCIKHRGLGIDILSEKSYTYSESISASILPLQTGQYVLYWKILLPFPRMRIVSWLSNNNSVWI